MSTDLSTIDRVQQDTQTKNRIVEDVESYAKSSIGLGNSNDSQENVVKVLGQNWNVDSDEILFDFDYLIEYAATLPSTKRLILKVTAKVFDPLGFLSPVTVVMKILFQKLCIGKVEWDKELKGDILGEWKKILGTLRCLEVNKIPRCYFEFNSIDVQFHGFSDASDRAYAAVVYVRSCYEEGRIDVRLLASKAKVSPLIKQSIPRLELLGALLLARLLDQLKSCRREFNTVC